MRRFAIVLVFFLIFSLIVVAQTKNSEKPNSKITNTQTQPTQEKSKNSEDKTSDELMWAIVIFLGFFTVVGFIYGITDKAIFYLNSADLFASFLPFVMALIGIAIAGGTEKEWIMYVGFAISGLLLMSVFYKSFVYNKTFLPSFSTAIAKLVLSFLILFKILEVFFPSGNTAYEKNSRRAGALIFLAFLTPIVIRLINGERVLAKRAVKVRA